MRLFIAIQFTPEIKNALTTACEQLHRYAPEANITRRENLHLTLVFIGESRHISDVREILDSIDAAPFTITTGGAGRFGDLWWAGVEQSAELSAIAGELSDRLATAGFDIDRRPFKPHVTLARKVRVAGDIRLSVPRVTQTVESIDLMKSERINGRLLYPPVYRKNLTSSQEFR